MLRQSISLTAAFALCGGVGSGGKSDVSPKENLESSHKASTTDTPDGLMVSFLSEVNAISDAMEKKESKETVDRLFQKAEATNKKLREWSLPTEDKKKLEDKYRPEIEKSDGEVLPSRGSVRRYGQSSAEVHRDGHGPGEVAFLSSCRPAEQAAAPDPAGTKQYRG
jgi:hypothetical protein